MSSYQPPVNSAIKPCNVVMRLELATNLREDFTITVKAPLAQGTGAKIITDGLL